MTTPDWLAAGQRHVWLPYTQMKTAGAQLPVVSASGSRLKLADGRELVDGIASWWTAAHGYRHPHIETTVERQLKTLPHVMLGGLAHEQAYRLATRLAALLPADLDHVFFSESGSVAVEIAMKMAVQYWLNQGERRTRFLSFTGGYHGDTLATMSVCDPDEGMHGMFRGVVPDQFVVDLTPDSVDAALEKHGAEIAAVLVEPLVQGAGGMRFHDAEMLRHLRAACDRHGALLIFDEIFVGFGRLGEALFACEEAGVTPDIITLSKALTGGTLPLSATIARDRVFDAFLSDDPAKALMHGPTYMGNALACAAANASLDLFEQEPRLDQARAIGALLAERLEAVRGTPGVADVRTKGALGVIELTRMRDSDWLKARFIEEGIWLRPFGNIIYTTPPLTTDLDDVARIADVMVRVTRE
ncbi:adenosylmethionine--8-amino-7-oxononanoate transaminase [Tardibacter chloracetimidivorans]|uniref:Adenosylmethionine-8-amino-7-oxononanoate aminotransferase n=1 Tax=Tardibacter chloracetimidivorans TaxID=1921510 RepID=A0A1L3ZRS3_9SPHN|nr:adenosylmethionine--8-amino-7-oxononanoate transaminase [Tardibacter chloracetimidivorans]API58332.1 adenosylmethionine--8-amino-7-oxononanoate transaminase [Tardibacter chloracetimidivorans]